MLRVLPVGLATSVALIYVSFAGSASAQLPTRSSEPRLVVPRTEVPVVQTPGQPTAPQVITQPSGQTAAAGSPDTTPPQGAANAPVTQVTGAPSGVTQLGGGAQPTSSSSYAAIAAYGRGYTAGKFILTLSGIDAGFPFSVEGGGPTSDVVSEKLAADHIIHKHLAGVKYDDISVTTTILAKPLVEWIAQSLSGQYTRKDGSVIMADYDYKPVSELNFFHALITEVTFPKLDATSKDAAKIIVKLSPEYTRLVAGSGTRIAGASKPDVPKKWLPSNFRFEMNGLDGSYVNSIESFTVSQKVVDNAVGELRDYEKEPAHLDIPNLKVTVAESHAQTWYAWLNDFVVQGNNSNDKERDGSIVYYSPNFQTELGRINLFGCGIFGLKPAKSEIGTSAGARQSPGDNIARVTADLYCERMELKVPDTKN